MRLRGLGTTTLVLVTLLAPLATAERDEDGRRSDAMRAARASWAANAAALRASCAADAREAADEHGPRAARAAWTACIREHYLAWRAAEHEAWRAAYQSRRHAEH